MTVESEALLAEAARLGWEEERRPALPVRVWRGLLAFSRRKTLGAFGGMLLLLPVLAAVFLPGLDLGLFELPRVLRYKYDEYELGKDVLVGADMWTWKPQMLAGSMGFNGILGVPGLDGNPTVEDAREAVLGVPGAWLEDLECEAEPSINDYSSAASTNGIAFAYGWPVEYGDGMPLEFSWLAIVGMSTQLTFSVSHEERQIGE